MKNAWIRLLSAGTASAAGAAVVVLQPAWADSADTFNVSAGYTVQTDSNLFRLPASSNAVAALGTTKKSERIDVTSVKLTLDKAYSLQRFQLTASYDDYHHQNFDYLNFGGLSYSGAWLWSFTPRVRGVLTAERKEALNNFADVGGITIRNVRTDSSVKFEGEGDLGAAVRLLGGVSQSRRTNEVAVIQEGDSSVDSLIAGMAYVFPSGNSVAYRFRKGSGDSTNRLATAAAQLPTGFDEREHEVRAGWKLTGKTSLNARLSWLDRAHRGLPERDFDGPTANLGVTWNPTAKTSVAAGAARSLSSYQTASSSYITSNRLNVAPTWRATEHISLRLNYDYLVQTYEGALPGQGLPENRRDVTRFAVVALDWRPRPFFSMTVSVQNQRRSSNTPGFDFNSNAANIGALVNF